MKNFILLFVIAAFLAGCASTPGTKPIEVYTFQKDRVDQKLSGNQGYLEGDAPPITEPRKTKRTLIGIDVEVPDRILPESSTSKTSASSATTSTTTSSAATQTQVKQQTTASEEEQWIK